jgi:glycosyltransferase involved in cell wall biosynthesis
MTPYRIAYLVSHPIQYQAPLLRRLAAHPDVMLQVYFMDDQGARVYEDPEFGVPVQWDVPLLEGYAWQLLHNRSPWRAADHVGRFIHPEIVRVLRRGRFDALIVHGYAHVTEWLAFLAARLCGTPLLLRGESILLGRPATWRGRIKRGVRAALLRRVQGALAIGALNREFYRAHGVAEHRIFFTPYAVDNDRFMTDAERLRPRRNELRVQLGWPGEIPVILVAGKLIPRKRPMDVLDAYAQVVREAPSALVFLGEGSERARLETAAAGRGLPHVYVTGFVNQREISWYYAASDLIVLASSHEPWGLTLNEGMCFGLPVVASTMVGAAADLVHPRDNGFVYPVGDINALAGALRAILSDPSRRMRMGARSRELVADYSYDADVRGILDALRAVASPRRDASFGAPTAGSA